MTNRERLRQMTDEELAVEICDQFPDNCEGCPADTEDMCTFGKRANGLITWLKAEAEAEEEE